MAKIYSFENLQQKRREKDVYNRWVEFYQGQPYDELLESLVYEHENDFPLRSSVNWMDQLRHKAMVEVLDTKAQTHFLKNLIAEIQSQTHN